MAERWVAGTVDRNGNDPVDGRMTDHTFDQSWSSLTARVDSAVGRFVLFTKIKGASLTFNCTDGVNLWLSEVGEDDLKMKASASGTSSAEEFLSKIKLAIEDSNLQVSVVPQTLTVVFGKRPGIISMDLYETTAQEKKEELKIFLFALVDRVKTLEKNLEGVNNKLKTLEDSSKAEAPNVSPFRDQSAKKAKIAARPKPAKGQSVINPGAKRRGAARGVVFE